MAWEPTEQNVFNFDNTLCLFYQVLNFGCFEGVWFIDFKTERESEKIKILFKEYNLHEMSKSIFW